MGRTTKVVTDHANLKYLNSVSPQQSKLARWCMTLAEFDLYIVQEHLVPDFLSRNPIDKHPEFDNYVLPPIEVTNLHWLFRLIYLIMNPVQLNDTLVAYLAYTCQSSKQKITSVMFLVKK